MSRTTPAIERNRKPIGDELARWLDDRPTVLEIASGPGAHAAYFAERFPDVIWQPSEVDAQRLEDIRAWVGDVQRDNLRDPVRLDVIDDPWPVERVDLILSINMIHIAPFPAAATGLFHGASKVLTEEGVVVLYGPFFRADAPTAPSNDAFDQSLRARIPGAGIRKLEDVTEIARARGLTLAAVAEMPANNCFVVFSRAR